MSTVLAPTEVSPVVLHFGSLLRRMSDHEFFEFCQQNQDWRIERTAEGDLIIMPPTGGNTGQRNAARVGVERSMPHRFHRTVLGGPVRRRQQRARAPGHGIGRAPARPALRSASAAPLPALRPDTPRPRVYKRIPARDPGERRAVHPRRDLVGHGIRRAGRGRQGRRSVRSIEPHPSCRQSRGR